MPSDPLTELEVATQKHFMPIVINQIYLESPVLVRIFRTAKEGQWGMALPSFDGRSIVEPLETGEVNKEVLTYSTGTVTTTTDSTDVTGSGTSWVDAMVGGQITLADGKTYAIAAVNSATSITLKTPYEGTGGAGQSYSIKYWAQVVDSAGAYNKNTVWNPGKGDVLSGAEFAWKINQKGDTSS